MEAEAVLRDCVCMNYRPKRVAALDSLLAYIKQLEGERDWGREQADFATEASTAADLAERENERLRGALWRIAECAHPDPDWHRDKARSALVAHTEEPR